MKKTGKAPTRTVGKKAQHMEADIPSSFRIRPIDGVGMIIAAAASIMILVNALLLQNPAAPAHSPRAAAAPFAERPQQANTLVKEVQSELGRRGIYDGVADGVTGPNTVSAIRSYQIAAGLEANGEATPELLAVLRHNTQPTQPAAAGIPPSDVLQVQRLLVKLGHTGLKPDGVVGEATRTAIRKFEAKRGLPQKGEVTAALKRELSVAAKDSGR
ncbi:peptidoglycan-binding domain-containing protein [Terrihabitans rhizophilus]|uniref:Peptidoglycan-binding domain-containing protein n=1 Tax=Terrihabitans rhizophilus TaxID=3092662 RepID=A0ABU4RP08_9HYPH|nr:peptidoglycan-binding domain-containing protein [Terrihabitans sp. PJ23]MDX6806549.1 peptidoglycan-binding domain-containing protein [Terrihabitans sp. PJ23]